MHVRRSVLYCAIVTFLSFNCLVACISVPHSSNSTGADKSNTASVSRSERLAQFLNFNLYAIETVTVLPKRANDNFHAHLDYQIELEKRGVLFGAGPLYEGDSGRPVAGLILVRAKSMNEARAIADDDPMHKSGARKYSLKRWKLNEGALHLTINFSDQSVDLE